MTALAQALQVVRVEERLELSAMLAHIDASRNAMITDFRESSAETPSTYYEIFFTGKQLLCQARRGLVPASVFTKERTGGVPG